MFSKLLKKFKLQKEFFERTGKKYRYNDSIRIGNRLFHRFRIPKRRDRELVLMAEDGQIMQYDSSHWGYDD